MKTNTILWGDCLDLIKDLPSGCIDGIVTDPPYSNTFTHNGNFGTTDDLTICRPFFRDLLREFCRVLKDNAVVYWFCDWRSYSFYYPLFSEILPVKNLVVWDKIAAPGSYHTYNHELIILAARGNINIGGSSVIIAQAFSSGAAAHEGPKVHPTQKSQSILAPLVRNAAPKGGLILDCFAGSCSTAIAAMQQGRNFLCFEQQWQYCAVGQKRVEKMYENYPFDKVEIFNKELFLKQ
jgi:site-specific DNA-methyltransferase (adenine-specific)